MPPPVAGRMPLRQSKRVDFPVPEPPTMATNEPGSMRKDTSLTNFTLPRERRSVTSFVTPTASICMPAGEVE